MIRSMTGFGRCEQIIDGFEIKVQLKSVNHRYSDFTIRAPRYYGFLEERVRAEAAKYISRGKVEIFITIEQVEKDDKEVVLNETLAQSYMCAMRRLQEMGVEGEINLATITRFSDLFRVEYKEIDEDKMFEMVNTVLTDACKEFISMREDEGKRMEADMRIHMNNILAEVEKVELRSPQSVADYAEKLKARIVEAVENAGVTVDEGRLLTEAAIFADKVAVSEETVRLKSHIKEFEKTFASNAPIGKKMDFIVQEMNREANTIGSKANDLELSKNVVEIKSEIEKIREQVQNIE